MAMAEDVPALQRMQPGGKPHPIDRILHHGDRVILGGTTLVARLTPGHTRGCTTWPTTVQEDGRERSVVIIGSMGSNPGFQFVDNKEKQGIADEDKQGFRVLRSFIDRPVTRRSWTPSSSCFSRCSPLNGKPQKPSAASAEGDAQCQSAP